MARALSCAPDPPLPRPAPRPAPQPLAAQLEGMSEEERAGWQLPEKALRAFHFRAVQRIYGEQGAQASGGGPAGCGVWAGACRGRADRRACLRLPALRAARLCAAAPRAPIVQCC